MCRPGGYETLAPGAGDPPGQIRALSFPAQFRGGGPALVLVGGRTPPPQVQKVKISHGSIGYMEYGFARRLGLPVALLQNQAGNFVKPDANSGRAALVAAAAKELPDDLRLFLPDPEGADSYPIVSLSWILLYDQYPQPEKAAALKKASTWGLTQGQTTAEEMGYILLPEVLVSKGTQAVTGIR